MNSPPVNLPGGNPVMDVPEVPISPLTTVGPMFVMLEKPKAPYVDAVAKSITAYKLPSDFSAHE
jgi:hypothetical protein